MKNYQVCIEFEFHRETMKILGIIKIFVNRYSRSIE